MRRGRHVDVLDDRDRQPLAHPEDRIVPQGDGMELVALAHPVMDMHDDGRVAAQRLEQRRHGVQRYRAQRYRLIGRDNRRLGYDDVLPVIVRQPFDEIDDQLRRPSHQEVAVDMDDPAGRVRPVGPQPIGFDRRLRRESRVHPAVSGDVIAQQCRRQSANAILHRRRSARSEPGRSTWMRYEPLLTRREPWRCLRARDRDVATTSAARRQWDGP